MSKIVIDGNWDIYSDFLKMRWSSLTETDLNFADKDVEALVARIQARTGAERETIAKAIKEASISGDMC